MPDPLSVKSGHWPEKNEVDKDPEPEKAPAPTQVHNTPWGVVSQEYGRFHPKVKAFIRWAVLVIAIVAAMNYGSAQLKSSICHWFPISSYFCSP